MQAKLRKQCYAGQTHIYCRTLKTAGVGPYLLLDLNEIRTIQQTEINHAALRAALRDCYRRVWKLGYTTVIYDQQD